MFEVGDRVSYTGPLAPEVGVDGVVRAVVVHGFHVSVGAYLVLAAESELARVGASGASVAPTEQSGDGAPSVGDAAEEPAGPSLPGAQQQPDQS